MISSNPETQDSNDLGEWEETTLGAIVNPTRPRISPSERPELPFIGMDHVEAHTMKLLGTVPAGTMKSAAVHFQPEDVLYGRLRPYLNKVYRATFEGLCSAEFIVFPETEGLDTRYLQYFLNSSSFVSYATQLNAGDRPRVKFEQLSSYPFPLPSIGQQQRIVAEIEKQFSRLDEAFTNLKRVKANLNRYKAAVLKAAVEGKLTEEWRKAHSGVEPASKLLDRILAERRAKWEEAELAKMEAKGKAPKNDKWTAKYKALVGPDITRLPELPEGWAWATVNQLSAPEPNSITDGPFGSNLKTAHYTESGPRVIRLQNIKDGEFADEYAHISSDYFEQLCKHQIHGNDLVIATLGDNPPRACIIPSFVGPAIVKADCVRLKPHSALMSAYLNAALNCHPTRQRIKGVLHGIGRPRLSLGEIRSIALPLPPEDEQHQIVAEVDRHLSLIRETETQVDINLKHAERLRESILTSALGGRLCCVATAGISKHEQGFDEVAEAAVGYESAP